MNQPTELSYTLCYNAKNNVINQMYHVANDRILAMKITGFTEILFHTG